MELISAAYVVPVDRDPIPDGALVVEMGRILAVGPRAELQARYPQVQQQHFATQCILPGLVNAHLHIDLAQFFPPDLDEHAKTADGQPMPRHIHWLKSALQFRQTARLEQVSAAIRYCLNRLVQCGVTCVGAMTNFDAALQLIDDVGLRAVIFPEIFASNPSEMIQDRFESALAVLDEVDVDSETLRAGFGVLAPYLVSRNLLRLVSQHARDGNVPVQIHAAESFDEMEFFFNSSGPIGSEIFPLLGWGPTAGQELPPPFQKTPIQYLEEIGFLEAQPNIIGCIQLGREDLPILQRRRCSVIYSPLAVQEFQLGEFPYGKLAEADVPIALGTESRLNPTDGDLWDEMRAALKISGITPQEILSMATRGGAQALRWDKVIGTLSPGKAADYLVVDLPPLPDPYFLVDSLIRHTTPNRIRQTVVAGQLLKNI